jgi:hypothetical protein
VEQRTRIRETVLRGGNAPRVTNINFSINVGTVVPRTIRVVTVPDVIVEVRPECVLPVFRLQGRNRDRRLKNLPDRRRDRCVTSLHRGMDKGGPSWRPCHIPSLCSSQAYARTSCR